MRLTPEESDAIRAIDSAAVEVMALYGGNLDHPALDHLEAAVGAIHAISAEQCGAGGCTNPPPPPDKWAKCFYDGSPCQRAER